MIAQILGEGRPLVVIHGFGVDHRIMLPLEDALARSGWQRIYIDLPWAAVNADGDVTSANHVAQGALNDIHEHLGGRPFAVIGNSFGGMIARHIAHELRDQVLGLATLAGVFEPDHQERNLPRRLVVREDPAVLALAGQARNDYEEMTVVQSEATLAAFTRYALPGLRQSKPSHSRTGGSGVRTPCRTRDRAPRALRGTFVTPLRAAGPCHRIRGWMETPRPLRPGDVCDP